MIEILRGDKKKIERTATAEKGSWICATDPTEEDIALLRTHVNFNDEVLASIKDPDEIPLLERYEGHLFFIVRIPKQKPSKDELEHTTAPIGIILSDNHFITISSQNDVIDRLKSTPFKTAGIPAVLQLLLVTSKTFLRYLKKIGAELYSTQEDLERSTENKEILQLLELEKSLVYFGTALKANQLLTEKIARSKKVIAKEENRELIHDIMIETQQALATNKIYSVIISEMVAAFGSIISNNLNKVIKTLTVITIILMLPTLVSSIYGMNVHLPLQENPHAFALILSASILLAIAGVLVLWKRKVF
ncbi:magnesium transporter CorA family protein [Candidatus Woesearchaeota archaeon]|nr:MAG: magnesium transporter CorA family protein [Candidatus Woesearchaeota archaeon]